MREAKRMAVARVRACNQEALHASRQRRVVGVRAVRRGAEDVPRRDDDDPRFADWREAFVEDVQRDFLNHDRT